MGRLSADRVLKDHRTNDAASVSALNLTHRALSNVSCLAEFKNLQRVDLGFNGLTSLEDLGPCSNLKWLSVVQNKLESLKGVESLSQLIVLNAGKNKLTSMDEVGSLCSLRALILNDNEIASICKLDQMKELNTLVLSRNPIQEIGKSLAKVTSLSKLSLSNCEIYDIGSSLKFCKELRELRLAHNHIKALPAELAFNKKLSNLDLGNNLFTRWSDMEVLKSLVKLKNLNLLGNPITENEKSMKKIRKVLPELKVFNAKPTNKSSKIEMNLEVDTPNELRPTAAESPDVKEKDRRNGRNEISGHRDQIKAADEIKSRSLEKEEKGKRKKKKKNEDPQEQKETTFDEDNVAVKKKAKRDSRKPDFKGVDALDDTEAPFLDLIETESANPVNDEKKAKGTQRAAEGGSVHVKKEKSKKRAGDGPFEFPSAVEIGMGGASSWDD